MSHFWKTQLRGFKETCSHAVSHKYIVRWQESFLEVLVKVHCWAVAPGVLTFPTQLLNSCCYSESIPEFNWKRFKKNCMAKHEENSSVGLPHPQHLCCPVNTAAGGLGHRTRNLPCWAPSPPMIIQSRQSTGVLLPRGVITPDLTSVASKGQELLAAPHSPFLWRKLPPPASMLLQAPVVPTR